jgi:DNA-binding CsgD family transcriptional regulator
MSSELQSRVVSPVRPGELSPLAAEPCARVRCDLLAMASYCEIAPELAKLVFAAYEDANRLGETVERLRNVLATSGRDRVKQVAVRAVRPVPRVGARAPRRADHVLDTDPYRVGTRLASLTAREREIFQLITSHSVANSSKALARRLDISPRTVECHRARVMRKMRARTAADLVTLAEICDLGG